jgi:ADP-heptose:LPS heptosyltransferase
MGLKIDYLERMGGGLGDTLLLTALFRQLRSRGSRICAARSDFPELFFNNPDIDLVITGRGYPKAARFWRFSRGPGPRLPQFCFNPFLLKGSRFIFRLLGEPGRPVYGDPPSGHIIDEMAKSVGIGRLDSRVPRLFPTPGELARAEPFAGGVAIQSSGKTSHTPNKEWGVEKFQGLVDALRDRCALVQLGTTGEPPLDGTMDLRGKTTLRQVAAILARSKVFVGQVGGLMHIARAVGTRGVIVYTGYEAPEQSGYEENINIYHHHELSPCWRREPCPHCREVAESITVEEVLAAVERALVRPRID